MAKYYQVKSQSSLEYLLIIAITLAVIVPTTFLFYNYSRESSQEVSHAQVIKLGATIVDSAESIFYSGVGSKTVLEVRIPENIEKVSIIDGRELVFNVSSDAGISEIVFFSAINLTAKGSECTLNFCRLSSLVKSGSRLIKVEAINEQNVRVETV